MEKKARLIYLVCFKVGKLLSEVLFVLSILFIMYIFTMIASEVFLTKTGNKLSDIGIWGLTTLGILLIISAVLMPFIVKEYFKSKITDYETIADLGTIGDFIGGTTVAFLTAASVVLLLATIIMQRKEIKISQESIAQLVKQTEATVQQAEEARKETKITNETMKRQQFETTFFNMISLHHNLTDRLVLNDNKGNEVIKSCLSIFGDIYYENANKKFKHMFLDDDYDEIVDLIGFLQMHQVLEVASVQLSSKNEVLAAFEKLDLKKVLHLRKDKKMLRDFFQYTYKDVDELTIEYSYHEFDINYDGILGSYFNSVLTIIRFLSESEFERVDKHNNTENNKIYREILFSQFTPHEMMMIYYYIKYLPSNQWLLEELKTYNLFYPRLNQTLFLFWSADENNIQELSK
ncbi:putative phage abortive infection protein [Bacillus sp. R1-10]